MDDDDDDDDDDYDDDDDDDKTVGHNLLSVSTRRFQASATVWLRPSLFWDVAWRGLAAGNKMPPYTT
jgi:hypothetical protein